MSVLFYFEIFSRMNFTYMLKYWYFTLKVGSSVLLFRSDRKC